MSMRFIITIWFLFASNLGLAATFKIATLAPEGTTWMREMRAAGTKIKQRTEGRVEIKFFPGGVMGNDSAVLRKIKLGQLQGGALSGGEWSQVFDDAQIYSLPFLFADLSEVEYVRAQVDPMLKTGFEKSGFVAVGISGGGFAYVMSTKPVATQEALRSTKVWVPQNDKVAQVAYEKAGVKAIALPLGDVYTSLQTGLLETVAITTSGAIAFQWHTKIKYVVDLPLSYVMGIMALDQRPFAKLISTDQTVVRDEFDRAFQSLDIANKRDNESARAVLVKQGITFKPPRAEEIQYWRDIGTTTLAEMQAMGAVSPELLMAIKQAQAQYRAKAPTAVIGKSP